MPASPSPSPPRGRIGGHIHLCWLALLLIRVAENTTDDCESQFTGRVPALPNPPPTLPVTTGPIFAQNRCNIPAQPHNMGTYTAPSE